MRLCSPQRFTGKISHLFFFLLRSVVGDGGSFQVCCFQFHPSDPDDIYAGTDTVSTVYRGRGRGKATYWPSLN